MAQQADFEDSNIAMLGSDLEKEVRKKAAETVEAYKGAGQDFGLQIWRIEKFKVIPWPKPQYGSFYNGDSFIILNTYCPNPDENPDKKAWDIHFWLGESTTQDEMGVAAYMTVVLDDLLGTEPVQYREVQDHESERFLDLWKGNGGIRIMEGGVDSGFNHVTPKEYKPRLLHVKGTRTTMRVKEVPCQAASMNQGDVFILDNGLDVITWQGEAAGVWEKRRAGDVVEAILTERNHKPKKEIVDGSDDHSMLWDVVGDKSQIKTAEEGGDDTKEDTSYTPKLLKVSDASGSMECTEVQSGSLKKSGLDGNDVFIVDCGKELFVWVGKGANVSEKRMGMKYATDYLASNGRPLHTPIAKVIEGAECPQFHKAFAG